MMDKKTASAEKTVLTPRGGNKLKVEKKLHDDDDELHNLYF